MKIKILNKNLQIEDDYTSAKTYEVAEGAVFTYTKNETLDSATIVIENQTERIEMSPYDIVEIFNYAGQRFQINNTSGLMCIDTYTETMTCVNPKIYRYEITLFSETKQLEGIILPNLKITKVLGETRTVYDYINQYMTEYCPQIKIRNGNNTEYSYKFKWVDDLHSLQNRFNIQCPEMQWNTPTLREVLNDLMMVADCIPILNNGTLSFMDLTEVTDTDWTNDTTHINYVTRSKSSEDYVSELQVKLENVTNKEVDVDNTVNRIEYCQLTMNDETSTLTTQNLTIKTQYPIYKLKSLKIMFPAKKVSSEGTTSQWYEEDLCHCRYQYGPGDFTYFNLVYEYQNWITKNILYANQMPLIFSNWANYQNTTLYYVRGGNEIFNFNNIRKFLFLTSPFYNELVYQIILNRRGIGETIDDWKAPEYYNFIFKVEYETLEGCVFRASKNDDIEHERVVIDNQTNSMVDSYAQGFLEYQKANRLGNEQLQINARVTVDDNIEIKIGDTYDDCVIYQVQYQIFKNHVEVNALATKNYILREYFTGVKSKIRSWAIASGSEALTRHDLIKYYCEFSYNVYNEIQGLDGLSNNNIAEYLCSPFVDNYTIQPIDYCFVRTKSQNNYYPSPSIQPGGSPSWDPSNTYYSLDLIKRLVGNSLIFTFEFNDNFWAGKRFDISKSDMDTDSNGLPIIKNGIIELVSDIVEGTTGVPTSYYSYTDSKGENEGGEIIFADGFRTALYLNSQKTDGSVADDDASLGFLDYIYAKPKVWHNQFYSTTSTSNFERIAINFNYYKDSQEITNISTQFEFSTETNDICFTKKMLKNQQAVALEHEIFNYKALVYTEKYYNFRRPDKLPQEGYIEEHNIDFRVTRLTNLTSNIWIIFKDHGLSTQTAARQFAQNVANGHCLYINNGDALTEDVLIALNNVPNNNCNGVQINGLWYPFIIFRLNILKTRNKNIYSSDNPYLKVGTIKV